MEPSSVQVVDWIGGVSKDSGPSDKHNFLERAMHIIPEIEVVGKPSAVRLAAAFGSSECVLQKTTCESSGLCHFAVKFRIFSQTHMLQSKSGIYEINARKFISVRIDE